MSDPELAVVRLFTVGDAAARTLAAYRAVESLCDRQGCLYTALAVHSTALGLDLGNLQDQATLIREVPHCSVGSEMCLSVTSRMQTPGSSISIVRCKDEEVGILHALGTWRCTHVRVRLRAERVFELVILDHIL